MVPPQDEEAVARGRGLERPQQAAVEPEVRRCPRDGAIPVAAGAGVLADPVRDSHEEVGVGAAGVSTGLGEAREAAPEGRTTENS